MHNIFFGVSLAHWLVLLSAALGLSGTCAYVRDMLRGESKPNLITWGLWGTVPLIATGAALTAHADGWATVRIFMSGFGPLIVFITAFFVPQSYWKLARFDFMCGIFSIIAIVLWLVADLPLVAILFAATADLLATLPTLIKAWRHPETETVYTYFIGLFTALLVVPAIPIWNVENAAFQIYLIIANTLLFLAVMRGYLMKRFNEKLVQ